MQVRQEVDSNRIGVGLGGRKKGTHLGRRERGIDWLVSIRVFDREWA